MACFRTRPNVIWEFFEKQRGKAQCYACSKFLSLGSEIPKKQTITNIQKHLEKQHPSEWERYSVMRTLQASEASEKKDGIRKHRRRNATKKVVDVPLKRCKTEQHEKVWTNEETEQLLQYLEKTVGFELPNAKVFYTTAAEETGIDVPWSAVQKKVRQLKRTFDRAAALGTELECTESTAVVGCEVANDKVLEICPHYFLLNNIFGSRDKLPAVDDTAFATESEEHSADGDADTWVDLKELIPTFESIEFSEADNAAIAKHLQPLSGTSRRAIRNEMNENCRSKSGIYRGLDQMADRQRLREIMESDDTRILQLEDRSLKLQEDKFLLEKHLKMADLELRREELRFKKMQLQLDEQIRRLEVEKDERIAKYELDLKYKVKASTN